MSVNLALKSNYRNLRFMSGLQINKSWWRKNMFLIFEDLSNNP